MSVYCIALLNVDDDDVQLNADFCILCMIS